MQCRESFDICKVCRDFILVRHLVNRLNLIRHLATKLQQTDYKYSEFRRPCAISKQLRHTLLWILQWYKYPSGITIITSAPPR